MLPLHTPLRCVHDNPVVPLLPAVADRERDGEDGAAHRRRGNRRHCRGNVHLMDRLPFRL